MVQTNKIEEIIDSLPPKFYSRLRLLTGMGPFTDGLEELFASVGILAAEFLYHPSTVVIAAMLGAYMMGVGFGAFIMGWIGDVVGRRTIFILDALLIGIFSLWSAFTYTELTYFMSRLLLGLAIGGDYSVALPLLSEYSPVKKEHKKMSRGSSLSFVSLLFMIGTVVGSTIGVVLELTIGLVLAMRVAFIIGAIPGFVLFFLRLDIPESLRWAVENGRKDVAKNIMAFFRKKHSYKRGDETYVNENFNYGKKNTYKSAIKNYFNKKNIRPVLYLMFMVSMYSFGVNYLGLYGAILYKELGATSVESLVIVTIGYTGGTLGTLIPVFWIDKLGRVKTAIFGFIFSAIIMVIYLVLEFTKTLTLLDMFIIDPVFLFVILGLVRTMAWVPSSEFGGAKSRGISQGWTKLWEFPTAFPAYILYGLLGVFFGGLFALMAIIAGIILVAIFGVETTGKTLEAIEAEEKSGLYTTAGK